MKSTRQGVRDLNSLPGRRLTPPRRPTEKVYQHSCSEQTVTIDCPGCLYNSWDLTGGECRCVRACRICGRKK